LVAAHNAETPEDRKLVLTDVLGRHLAPAAAPTGSGSVASSRRAPTTTSRT
jgi:hypothetical protein